MDSKKVQKRSKYINLINKDRLIRTFIELAKIKSPSKNEKQIAYFVSEKLKKIGLEVFVDDCGKKFGGNSGNIIAILKKDKFRIPIFLVAHLDTVALNGDIIPVLKNGRIINENKKCILGADDKVAVATILESLQTIKEKNIQTGDIYIIFTVSEEVGILGAKHLDYRSIKAKYGFVFDGEGDIGTIFNEAPYHNSFNIKIIGKASHAGISPEKGISSIKIASLAISQIKLGRIDKDTTCNIGKIEGGVERNIIPEITEVMGEARSLIIDKLERTTDDIINAFKRAANENGAKLKYEIEREYNGFKISEDEIPVIIAKNAIKNLGKSPKVISTGGGSDINIFNYKGKVAINLSSGMENVHSSKEYVKINQLEKLTALILEICTFDISKLNNNN
jgi:tripeptide aminopeptidase